MTEWLKKINLILCEVFMPSYVHYVPPLEPEVKRSASEGLTCICAPKSSAKPKRRLRLNLDKGEYERLCRFSLNPVYAMPCLKCMIDSSTP